MATVHIFLLLEMSFMTEASFSSRKLEAKSSHMILYVWFLCSFPPVGTALAQECSLIVRLLKQYRQVENLHHGSG